MTHQCDCGRVVPDELVEKLRSGHITTLVCSRGRGGCGQRQDRAYFDAKFLVRHGHPDTSREAAETFAPKQRQSQMRALGYVSENPGSTANELAKVAGDRDIRKIGRRLPELERFGLVRRGEPRPCKVTNRNASTWYPAENITAL